jgi:ketosteroid isomerase-like protein
MSRWGIYGGVVAIALTCLAISSHPADVTAQTGAPPTSARGDAVAQNLDRFDALEFIVFNHQEWDRIAESYAKDVVVTWPDGHQTIGIDQHIQDLKFIFSFAPDTSIKTHPIRFGSGDWTSVTGVIIGTFSQPMVMPDGRVISPTGHTFKMPMATIAQWKDGKIVAKSLFWDNEEFKRQLGVVK